MSRSIPIANRRRALSQGGFTLVEVLVALVILAIGCLGVTAMQVRGMNYTHDAYIRSQANVLAYDIAERMRSNAANADNYIASADPAGTCAATGAGTINDLNCWFEGLAASLPAGTGRIAADPGNANGYLVSVSWLDRTSGGMLTQQWAIEP